MACCPFHNEKTPSFHVYEDHYHCYGCGKRGDAFDWLQTQHGMELSAAIRHLGGRNGHDAAPPLHPDISALRAKRQADAEAKIKAARLEQIAEAERWWSKTRPITGTLAERYLIEIRGIPRPTNGWPDCLRSLPGRAIVADVISAGALVVAATTNDGRLCAVQRIYLDNNAQNSRKQQDAKRSKIKLTAGTFLDGAGVVRLPGPVGGPLVIAEGPETGLSPWIATGYETWIALGSIPKVTPPRSRRIVICRDDDKPHSAADKAITKAIAAWQHAKLDVVVAKPWPDRRGDGSDFNDTLRQHGIAGVRARIEAALNPGPRPPRRMSASDGRREVADRVVQFFEAAREWGDTPVTSKDIPIHLVQVDTGAGKSDIARKTAAKFLIQLRQGGDKRTVAMAVPSHALGNEQAERFRKLPQVRAAGLTCQIWRGRKAVNPADGLTMCRNPNLVDEVQHLKLDVVKTACKVCPHRDDCAYLSQDKLRADLWFVAHQMIFERKPRAVGRLAALMVDENALAASLEGHERTITLSTDVLARVDEIPDKSLATQRLKFLRQLALETMGQLHGGPLLRGLFVAAGLTTLSAQEANSLEWQTKIEVELQPSMKPTERNAALKIAERNADLGRRIIFWAALCALLDAEGPKQSGWAALTTKTEERILTLKGRRKIGKDWCVPTLLLDASARVELLRYVWRPYSKPPILGFRRHTSASFRYVITHSPCPAWMSKAHVTMKNAVTARAISENSMPSSAGRRAVTAAAFLLWRKSGSKRR